MKPSIEEVQNLLALKRHESPPEGFVDDFVREFNQRRREEAVRTGGFEALWRQATLWLEEISAARWAYGVGVSYALVLLAFILVPGPREQQQQQLELEPASYQVLESTPADERLPTEQLEALDLRPSAGGATGDQEF